MSIFDDINSGEYCMRRGDDAVIGNMRAAGKGWREIATALLMRRADHRERCEAIAVRNPRAITAARNWRDRARRERANA